MKYKLKPEHEARFAEWRDKWIANAMSTEPMTENDREICRAAVIGMYSAAKLPAPKHIVFVPSPFVLAFAGGFSAAIWHGSKGVAATRDATEAATEAATRAATWAATRAATRAATEAATRAATRAATWDATEAATRAATEAATRAATWDATGAATRAATWDATEAGLSNWYYVPADMRALAESLGVGSFGLQCAANSYRMWSGGNQWGGYDAFLSFFQDVAALPLDYSAYNHWRALAEHSGPRIMHPDFCMISDRPMLLKVDDENRSHAEAGPFCQWRDGSMLFSWHGQRIPGDWVTGNPPKASEALHWQNMDQRAAACEILGWDKIVDERVASGAGRIIEDSGDRVWGRLVELDLPDSPGERFLDAMCGTGRRFALPVPPKTKTVDEAQSVLHGGLPVEILKNFEVRT